jgi:hypothetical protein
MAWENMTERRKEKRVELRMILEFDDPDAPDGERRTCMETINFSAGGFYCKINREIQPLTRLALRFVFPPYGEEQAEEHPIDCEAVVVRCEPDGVEEGSYRLASCFTDLAAEDRDFIRSYLEWYELLYLEGGEEWDRPEESDEDVA